MWGGSGAADERAQRALARVQTLLGHGSVLTPVLDGGRDPAQRTRLVPWGDEPVPVRSPQQPWPGQLPAPAPSVLLDPPRPARVLDACRAAGGGHRTRRRCRAPPTRFGLGDERPVAITSWAGPWPVDERWWSPETARHAVRCQIVDVRGRAYLVTGTMPSSTTERAPGRSTRSTTEPRDTGTHQHPVPDEDGDMDFATLAVISLVGLAGPLLATPTRWNLPVVLGELAVGIVLGHTGLDRLHAGNSTFTFLADIGFALVMFVAGSHVPVHDPTLRSALVTGTLRALGVGAVAVVLGLLLAHAFGTGHAALYAVLMASSSAALVLPIVDSLGLSGPNVLGLLPQVAIADAACIIALPLAADPKHVGRAALGSLAVLGCAAVAYLILRELERRGLRRRVHRLSEKRGFAVELRVQLSILFTLAAVAVQTHVSIMLAGFSFGLAVSAIGEPRRLAKQLFALTDGFLGPLFFIWLGASLDLRALGHHPSYVVLGVLLGLGAVFAHAVARLTGQPLPYTGLAAAQLGVPVAAATIGTQLHLLAPGEPAALILGALITIAVAVLAGAVAARRLS